MRKHIWIYIAVLVLGVIVLWSVASMFVMKNSVGHIVEHLNTHFHEDHRQIFDQLVHAHRKSVEESVQIFAENAAEEIGEYLAWHPNKTIEQLREDPQFRRLAVRKVLNKGYTAVHTIEDLRSFIHPKRKLEGMKLVKLKDKIPSFWSLFSETQNEKKVNGYYDWLDGDKVKKKYMALVWVPTKVAKKHKVGIAATVYLEDSFGTAMLLQEVYEDDMKAFGSELKASGDKVIQSAQRSTIIVNLLVFAFVVLSIFYFLRLYRRSEASAQEAKTLSERIQISNKRLESMLSVSHYRADSNEDLLKYALEEALKISESKLGFVGIYHEETEEVTLNTWSADVMKECSIHDPQKVFQLEKTGLWTESIRKREPVIVNDYIKCPMKKGLPKGHAGLTRFLTLPVFFNDRIVSVLAVANKEHEYTSDDAQQLTLFMNSVWGLKVERDAKEKAKELQNQLAHSDRLASIGTIAAGIAHEVNNPLAVIQFNADILSNLLETEKGQDKLIDCIGAQKRSVERIAEIISGLRAYARADTEESTEVPIVRVVDEALSLVGKIYTKEGIEISEEIEDESVLVVGSFGKFQQVFMNLLSNARAAVNKNQGPKKIDIKITADEEYVQILLKDNGTGIAKEKLSRIWEPFFTTKKTGEGTGLGLSICLGIIEAYGGSIKVESEQGQGTKFIISLRRGYADNVVEIDSQKKKESDFMASQSILIVDDEADLRESLGVVLEALGHKVTITSSAQEAIEAVGQNDFDLVITDYKMPGMSGLDLIQSMQDMNFSKEPKIVVMTGDLSMDDHVRESIEKLSDYLLIKPFSKRAVVELLQKVS
jgi:C4-dicarboxylate-specific signal transduction histidine kinase